MVYLDIKLLMRIYFFMSDLMIISNDIFEKMLLAWTFIRKPTKNDGKWLGLVRGSSEAEKIMQDLRENRKISRRKKQQVLQARERISKLEKKIDRQIKSLRRFFAELIETFPFPCNEIIEIIYPKHFQRILITLLDFNAVLLLSPIGFSEFNGLGQRMQLKPWITIDKIKVIDTDLSKNHDL